MFDFSILTIWFFTSLFYCFVVLFLVETCIFRDVFYTNKLDSNTQFQQVTSQYGTTTVADGIMSGGSAYLTDGWDNTGLWKLELDALMDSRDGVAVFLLIPTQKTARDADQLLLHSPAWRRIQARTGSSIVTEIMLPTYNWNTWYHVTVTKINSTQVIVNFNGNDYTVTWSLLESLTRVTCGVDSWDTSKKSSIKNVEVIEL